METKKILLISTGGTIAGNVAKVESSQHKNANHFEKSIKHTKDNIKKKWAIDLNITATDLIIDKETVDVDSSDIIPEHWNAIIQKIEEEYDNYHAFIITHGTNTLGYTSAALSFAFANINKPVILTGSQVPLGFAGSDAIMNLDNSLRVAAWPYHKIKGVIVVFGSSIITGTRVKKSTEFDYDAFKSFTSNSLGEIGRIIQIDEEELKKHNDYYTPLNMDSALTSEDLVINKNFDMNILSLTEFPGMPIDFFKTMVEEHNIRGFILRSFGAGDPSKRLLKIFEYLKTNYIPLIITTQAPNGNANFQVNTSGQKLKEDDLAIPAYNMSVESTTTKLAWLLAKYPENNETSYKSIKEKMLTDIKGEIKVMTERKQ